MLEISNTNRAFLEKILEIIGKGSIGFNREKRCDWKDRWQYHGSAAVLRGILPQILAHLVIKQERAVRMLEYLAFIDKYYRQRASRHFPPGYYERLDSLYSALKRLNAKDEQSSRSHTGNQSMHPWNPPIMTRGTG